MWTYGFGNPGTLDGRFGGLFVSAKYLVFFIAPAFVYQSVLLVQELMGKKWRDIPMYTYTIAVVLGLGIMLARSYASWIVLAIIFLGVAVALLPKKIKIGAVMAVVVWVAFLGYYEFQTDKGVAFLETTERSSTSVRLEVYEISKALIVEHPIMGIGMGQYEFAYKMNAFRMLGKIPYEWVMLHPHNLFLSMWLSLGLLGALWLLYVVFVWLYGFLISKSYAFSLPFLYILLHGIVDTPFWKPDLVMIFMLCLVIALPTVSILPLKGKKVT
jgi:O-antigen ligase